MNNQVDLSQQYGFGYIQSLGEGYGHLVAPAFEIAAAVVVIYTVMAGFSLLTSSGDKDKISKAQAMITHSIVGFLLLMAMFLILQFIPEFFGLKGFKIIQ